MAELHESEHQEMAVQLDGLLRIAHAKQTSELRLAFGRALHKAFTTPILKYSGHSTAGLEWIAGREDAVAEVLGNTSAFFESLVSTIAAPAIVNSPKLFAMIDPGKQLQFVSRSLDVRSPLSKTNVRLALRSMGLSNPETQRFMLTLFERYAEDPGHPIWIQLWHACQVQLTWGALWEHLTADELQRLLLSVAKAQPTLLISQETSRISSLLIFRLPADVIDEIIETAICSMKSDDFNLLLNDWMAIALDALGKSVLYERHLAIVWSPQTVHTLAVRAAHEVNLSAYSPVHLGSGLEYVSTQLAVFRDRQFDCLPLFRMRRWCLEAFLVLGYAEAPLVKELDEYERMECVAYHEGRRYIAFNQCSKLPAGTRVLFFPGVTPGTANFYAIPE